MAAAAVAPLAAPPPPAPLDLRGGGVLCLQRLPGKVASGMSLQGECGCLNPQVADTHGMAAVAGLQLDEATQGVAVDLACSVATPHGLGWTRWQQQQQNEWVTRIGACHMWVNETRGLLHLLDEGGPVCAACKGARTGAGTEQARGNEQQAGEGAHHSNCPYNYRNHAWLC